MRSLLVFSFIFFCFSIEAHFSSALQEVEICYVAPTAEEFVNLRTLAGMRPRSITSAEKGLKNSLFWITLRNKGRLIGMGRVVGDGGTIVQITDICIDPELQGKGYGTFVLNSLQDYILEEIPDDAFVCLFSEKKNRSFLSKKRIRTL